MGYAIELFLDEGKSETISRLMSTTNSILATIGTKPHISLATFKTVDISALTSVVETFTAEVAPFSVHLSSIGMFPGAERRTRQVAFAREPGVHNAKRVS